MVSETTENKFKTRKTWTSFSEGFKGNLCQNLLSGFFFNYSGSCHQVWLGRKAWKTVAWNVWMLNSDSVLFLYKKQASGRTAYMAESLLAVGQQPWLGCEISGSLLWCAGWPTTGQGEGMTRGDSWKASQQIGWRLVISTSSFKTLQTWSTKAKFLKALKPKGAQWAMGTSPPWAQGPDVGCFSEIINTC